MKRCLSVLALSALIALNPLWGDPSQEPDMSGLDIELTIETALDYFSEGLYEESLYYLNLVLMADPYNKRAADIKASVEALYNLEKGEAEEQTPVETEKPDFSVNRDDSSRAKEDDETEEELEKPDFSVRNDDSGLVQPVDTRTALELSFSSSLVLPWDIGTESVVFPDSSDYSGHFSGEMAYFPDVRERIFGISGTYSLFLFNLDESDFADEQLHVVDVLVNFRTFFSEAIDSKIIFRIGVGYRGYYSGGYDFYIIERETLHGFNMGINLEMPLIYLFWQNDFWKNLIIEADVNLLFFPELNTLNLFDFKISSEYRFKHFSAGFHFGAQTVIGTDEVNYIWMTGLGFGFSF